jgi:uncharacterized protein
MTGLRGLLARGALVAAMAGAACARDNAPLTSIGDGWFIDQGPADRPAAHLYRDVKGTRVVVDRQIEAYRLYYSHCLVYQVAVGDGHALLGVVGNLTPLAIVTSDALHPWRLDGDALRRFEAPVDPGGRTLLNVTSMKVGDICGAMQIQPRFTEALAARARATPGHFPVEESTLDVNGSDSVGNSILSDAAQEGQVATVDELLQAGADPNSANDAGITVLMTAIAFGHPEVVPRLLTAGARVDAQDDRGTTALMVAAKYRSDESARALLDAGADATVRDDSGRNAAGWVPDSGGAELAALRARLEQSAASRQH